jgi:hypothetical protein
MGPAGGFCSTTALPFLLSSRPKRTRISYFALLATTTRAALLEESRMQTIKATGLHRKSGGAQWRDLCVDALSWKCSRQRTQLDLLLLFSYSGAHARSVLPQVLRGLLQEVRPRRVNRSR